MRRRRGGTGRRSHGLRGRRRPRDPRDRARHLLRKCRRSRPRQSSLRFRGGSGPADRAGDVVGLDRAAEVERRNRPRRRGRLRPDGRNGARRGLLVRPEARRRRGRRRRRSGARGGRRGSRFGFRGARVGDHRPRGRRHRIASRRLPHRVRVEAPVGDRGVEVGLRGRNGELRIQVVAPLPRQGRERRRSRPRSLRRRLHGLFGHGRSAPRRRRGGRLHRGDRPESLGLRDHLAEAADHLVLGLPRFVLGEGPREVRPALVAGRGVLRERLGEDRVELGGDGGVDRLQPRVVLVDDLVGDRGDVVAEERLLLRQELVEDDAEGKEVAPAVDHLARDLLRRHVVRRPEKLPGLGQARGLDLRDAEVGDLHRAVGGDDDVRGLHVAVDDAAPVRVIEGLGGMGDDLRDPVPRERLFLADQLLQVLSLDVLHGDEGGLVLLAHVVHGDDVRVVEGAGGLGFAEEPLAELALLEVVLRGRADRLERDEAADHRVLSEVDDAHRALAQLADDLVPAESFRQTRERRPCFGRQKPSPGRDSSGNRDPIPSGLEFYQPFSDVFSALRTPRAFL